jgi:heptaprenyl diphosphate synthase
VQLQARTFSRLVVGQISETAGPADGEDAVSHHLQVVADKTGSLIATSARLGALLAGAPATHVETVARYGELVGVAFQLSDDIIDVASDRAQSGKTPGTDLREGIRTLPALLVLAGRDPAGARLRDLVSRPLSDDGEHAEALRLLRGSAALGAARATLADYAQRSRQVADELPAGPVRDALHALTDYVLVRTG